MEETFKNKKNYLKTEFEKNSSNILIWLTIISVSVSFIIFINYFYFDYYFYCFFCEAFRMILFFIIPLFFFTVIIICYSILNSRTKQKAKYLENLSILTNIEIAYKLSDLIKDSQRRQDITYSFKDDVFVFSSKTIDEKTKMIEQLIQTILENSKE